MQSRGSQMLVFETKGILADWGIGIASQYCVVQRLFGISSFRQPWLSQLVGFCKAKGSMFYPVCGI